MNRKHTCNQGYITSNFYEIHNAFFNNNPSNAAVLKCKLTEKIQIYLKIMAKALKNVRNNANNAY